MSALEIAYVALGIGSAIAVIGGTVWLAIVEGRRRTDARQSGVRPSEGESPPP